MINSSKKRENIKCFLIIIMFLLIYPAMILGEKFTKNIRIVLGCIIAMIGISYLLYRIYKIVKNELNKKYWKSLFDLEIKELKIKYEELFFCNNDALKKKRDKVILSKIIVFTGIVIPLVIFYYVCKLNLNNSELITLFFIIMYILLIYLLTNKERKCIENFKSLYKWDVISKYIGNINSELIYEESLLNFAKLETDYKYAEFDIVDNNSIWETKCEDYIFGKLNDNTYMEMSDIVSKEIVRRRRGRRN